jgi:hypothetical protein
MRATPRFFTCCLVRLVLVVLLCTVAHVLPLEAQYDTDGNGYAEVFSLYRDENSNLIWSIADLS